METATDFAASIRYALSERRGANGRVELVLDLFRGAAPVLTRTLACLEPEQAGAVARRCRARLDERGAHAVARASAAEAGADPAAAPATAHAWVFTG